MEYPKWITRAPGIGAVLVTSTAEEKELLESWDTEQAEEATAAAKAESAAARESAQVVLKKQGK